MHLGVFDSPTLIPWKNYTPDQYINTDAHSNVPPHPFLSLVTNIYMNVCRSLSERGSETRYRLA